MFTPDETAREFKVSRSRVYELIESGELKSVKLGRLRRIRETDLRAFVDGLSA